MLHVWEEIWKEPKKNRIPFSPQLLYSMEIYSLGTCVLIVVIYMVDWATLKIGPCMLFIFERNVITVYIPIHRTGKKIGPRLDWTRKKQVM